MKVLSLFDGCGCAYQALHNLGIEPECYFASEVDKYAISISIRKNRRGRIFQLGDVKNVGKNFVMYPYNHPVIQHILSFIPR